jgi:hypothetical protein
MEAAGCEMVEPVMEAMLTVGGDPTLSEAGIYWRKKGEFRTEGGKRGERKEGRIPGHRVGERMDWRRTRLGLRCMHQTRV